MGRCAWILRNRERRKKKRKRVCMCTCVNSYAGGSKKKRWGFLPCKKKKKTKKGGCGEVNREDDGETQRWLRNYSSLRCNTRQVGRIPHLLV